MQLTDDPVELVKTTVIITLFVGLVVIHLSLAFRVGLKTHGSRTWKLLAGLSAGSAVVWFILALAISLMLIFDKPSNILGPANDTYTVTFGLPFKWNIVGRFLAVSAEQIPAWLAAGCAGIVVALISFLLAIFAATLARIFLRGSAVPKR